MIQLSQKKLAGLERNNGDEKNTVDGKAMTRKQIFERILKNRRFLISVVSSEFPKEEFNIEMEKSNHAKDPDQQEDITKIHC